MFGIKQKPITKQTPIARKKMSTSEDQTRFLIVNQSALNIDLFSVFLRAVSAASVRQSRAGKREVN